LAFSDSVSIFEAIAPTNPAVDKTVKEWTMLNRITNIFHQFLNKRESSKRRRRASIVPRYVPGDIQILEPREMLSGLSAGNTASPSALFDSNSVAQLQSSAAAFNALAYPETAIAAGMNALLSGTNNFAADLQAHKAPIVLIADSNEVLGDAATVFAGATVLFPGGHDLAGFCAVVGENSTVEGLAIGHSGDVAKLANGVGTAIKDDVTTAVSLINSLTSVFETTSSRDSWSSASAQYLIALNSQLAAVGDSQTAQSLTDLTSAYNALVKLQPLLVKFVASSGAVPVSLGTSTNGNTITTSDGSSHRVSTTFTVSPDRHTATIAVTQSTDSTRSDYVVSFNNTSLTALRSESTSGRVIYSDSSAASANGNFGVSVTGQGDITASANGIVTLGGGVTATVFGPGNTLNLAAGTSLTVSGSGDVINASSAEVHLQAGTTSASISGSGLTVNGDPQVSFSITGGSNSIVATNDSITLKAGTTSASISGSGLTVNGDPQVSFSIAGKSNSIVATNDSITLKAGTTSASISGSGLTVNGDPQVSFSITGKSNSIVATNDSITLKAGTASLKISGSNLSLSGDPNIDFSLTGHGNTVTATNDTINLLSGVSNTSVLGDGMTLHGQSNIDFSVSGTNDTIDGTNDLVTLNAGTSQTLVTGIGVSVTCEAHVSFSISGTGDSVTGNDDSVAVAPDAQITLFGYNLKVNVGADAICTVSGLNDILTAINGQSITTAASNLVALAYQNLLSSSPQLISQLGSQIGAAIAGSNPFAQIGTTALLTTFGLEVVKLANGSLLDGTNAAGASGLSELDAALSDTFGTFVTQLQGAGFSILGSSLVADAAQQLGLKGFAGQVFTLAGNSIEKQIFLNYQQIVGKGTPLTSEALFNGLKTADIVKSFGLNLGNLLGAKVASSLFTADSVGQSLFINAGGSLASMALGETIGAGVESALGLAGESAAAATASSVAGEAASLLLGNLIFPGVGSLLAFVGGAAIGDAVFSFVDDITGGFFDDLFGGGSTWEYQYSKIDPATGMLSAPNDIEVINGAPFNFDGSKNTTAQLRNGTHELTNATNEAVNKIISLIGGRVDTTNLIDPTLLAHFAWVGDNKSWGNNDYQVEWGPNNSYYVNAAGDPAHIVRMATVYDLAKMKFIGGDPILVRAFDAWKKSVTDSTDPTALTRLSSDLQIAEDTNTYLMNTAAINAVIKAAPTSSFSRGWIDTLTQAESLGLNAPAQFHSTITTPPQTTAGSAFPITVTIQDVNDNVATGYNGTVTLWSNDTSSLLPSSYAFTAADHGTHVFFITPKSAGSHSIVANAEKSSISEAAITPSLAAPAVNVTSPASGKVTVSWNLVTGATSYEVYQYVWATGVYNLVGTVDGNTSSFTKAVATSGVKKYYVEAIAGSSSTNSATASVTEAVTPTITSVAQVNNQLQVNWTPDVGVDTFKIWEWLSSANTYQLLGTAGPNVTMFTTNSLSAGTHRVLVQAVSGSVWANSPSVDSKLVPPPTLTATSQAPNNVLLKWTTVPGATVYNIYKFNIGLKAYELIGTANANTTSFTKSVSASGQKQFYIQAVTGSGWVNSAIVTTTMVMTPTLTSVKQVNSQVSLGWTADPNVDGFNVYKWNFSTNAYVLLGTVSASVTTFTTGSVAPGTKRFLIQSFIGSTWANSPTVDINVVTAPTLTAAVRTPNNITLTWSAVPGATSYSIFNFNYGQNAFALVAIVNGNVTTFVKSVSVSGQKQLYVQALTGSGWVNSSVVTVNV
jgi:hypothetical protein